MGLGDLAWRREGIRGHWTARRIALLGLFLLSAVLVSAATAAAAPILRWSGGANAGFYGWSNTSNWEGGVAPSSSEAVALEFSRLTSSSCTSTPPTDSCYESENNITGLNVESLQVEDSQTYVIEGEPITLGSGGLAAAPATNTTEQIGSIIAMPIALGASQTWNIVGQSGDNAIDGNQLVFFRDVSGASHPLNMKMSEGGGLVLVNENEVGPLSLEGADPNRAGILNGVTELYGAQLNSSDHEPVSFNHIFVVGTGATGPLTTNAAEILLEPGENSAERLEVQNATLDPESHLIFTMKGAGDRPGIDYAQLASTGTLDLKGAELDVAVAKVCKVLSPGTEYTLVTSTGPIVGSFGNAGEGKEIPVRFPKGCTIAQTLHIEYHRSGGTQTVTGTVIAGSTSTTALKASPTAPIVNQNVTLTATVTTSGETPSGTVQFEDDGSPIPACASEPVLSGGSGYTATCHTSFVAAGSPRRLSAGFTPEPGLNLQGSSTTEDLPIGQGSTTTALQSSPSTTVINQSVIYTATVSTSANGPALPGGTVAFADNGAPIASCSSVSLQAGVSPSTAVCQLSYPSQGAHSITASYSGDGNFASSSSSAQTVTVQPSIEPPVPPFKFPDEEIKPGNVKLDGTGVPVHARTTALVKLTCDGAATCNGKLTLYAREVGKGKHGKKTSRSVKIGSTAFSIGAGKTINVDVHLDATGQTLLRNHQGRISASLQLAQDTGSTQSTVHLAETASHTKRKG